MGTDFSIARLDAALPDEVRRSSALELGIGDDDWKEVDTVRLSPDGLNILIGGFHMPDLSHSRAVVLHLTPKADVN